MTRIAAFLVSLGLLILTPGATRAGVLTAATWVQSSVNAPWGPDYFSAPMPRTIDELGASGTATSTAISVTLSYPPFTTRFVVPRTSNEPFPSNAVEITQGGPQAITATVGMGAGTPAVPGRVAVHYGSTFSMGNTLVQLPIGVGKAGLFTATFAAFGVIHDLRVDFDAWTPGSVTFTGLYYDKPLFCSRRCAADRVSLPNVTTAGSFDLTPLGGGTVMLVSPTKLSVDGWGARRTAAFTRLRLSFKGSQCSDGRDNDGDGAIDLADADCRDPHDNLERFTAGGWRCGLGPELMLALAALLWLRSGSRRGGRSSASTEAGA
jgi:hypothetical protein